MKAVCRGKTLRAGGEKQDARLRMLITTCSHTDSDNDHIIPWDLVAEVPPSTLSLTSAKVAAITQGLGAGTVAMSLSCSSCLLEPRVGSWSHDRNTWGIQLPSSASQVVTSTSSYHPGSHWGALGVLGSRTASSQEVAAV